MRAPEDDPHRRRARLPRSGRRAQAPAATAAAPPEPRRVRRGDRSRPNAAVAPRRALPPAPRRRRPSTSAWRSSASRKPRRAELEIIDPIDDSLGELDSELEAVFETSDARRPPQLRAAARPRVPHQAPPKAAPGRERRRPADRAAGGLGARSGARAWRRRPGSDPARRPRRGRIRRASRRARAASSSGTTPDSVTTPCSTRAEIATSSRSSSSSSCFCTIRNSTGSVAWAPTSFSISAIRRSDSRSSPRACGELVLRGLGRGLALRDLGRGSRPAPSRSVAELLGQLLDLGFLVVAAARGERAGEQQRVRSGPAPRAGPSIRTRDIATPRTLRTRMRCRASRAPRGLRLLGCLLFAGALGGLIAAARRSDAVSPAAAAASRAFAASAAAEAAPPRPRRPSPRRLRERGGHLGVGRILVRGGLADHHGLGVLPDARRARGSSTVSSGRRRRRLAAAAPRRPAASPFRRAHPAGAPVGGGRVVSWLPQARAARAITKSAFRSMKFLQMGLNRSGVSIDAALAPSEQTRLAER